MLYRNKKDRYFIHIFFYLINKVTKVTDDHIKNLKLLARMDYDRGEYQ